MSPSMRILGRSPAVMCRSEAPRWIISSSSERRLTLWAGAAGAAGWGVAVIRSARRFLDDFLEGGDALLHFHDPIHPEGEHALGNGHLLQLGGGRAAENHASQLRRQRHDLVQTGAALVTGTAAGIAAGTLEEAHALELFGLDR